MGLGGFLKTHTIVDDICERSLKYKLNHVSFRASLKRVLYVNPYWSSCTTPAKPNLTLPQPNLNLNNIWLGVSYYALDLSPSPISGANNYGKFLILDMTKI